jgi:hypothetical protein
MKHLRDLNKNILDILSFNFNEYKNTSLSIWIASSFLMKFFVKIVLQWNQSQHDSAKKKHKKYISHSKNYTNDVL